MSSCPPPTTAPTASPPAWTASSAGCRSPVRRPLLPPSPHTCPPLPGRLLRPLPRPRPTRRLPRYPPRTGQPLRRPRPSPPAEATGQQAPATGGPARDQAPTATSGAAESTAPGGGLSLVEVRRLWPDIVDATKLRRRVTWIHLTQNAQVVAVDERTLTLGFANSGARDSFDGNGSAEIVRQAAIDVVGADWRIETIVDPGASPDAGPPAAPRPSPGDAAPAQPAAPAPAAPVEPPPTPAAPATPVAADEPPPPWAVEPPAGLADEPEPSAPAAPPAQVQVAPAGRASIDAARGAILQTRAAGAPVVEEGPDLSAADADAHPDDEVVEHDSVADAELLARELGARVIEEINHT